MKSLFLHRYLPLWKEFRCLPDIMGSMEKKNNSEKRGFWIAFSIGHLPLQWRGKHAVFQVRKDINFYALFGLKNKRNLNCFLVIQNKAFDQSIAHTSVGAFILMLWSNAKWTKNSKFERTRSSAFGGFLVLRCEIRQMTREIKKLEYFIVLINQRGCRERFLIRYIASC